MTFSILSVTFLFFVGDILDLLVTNVTDRIWYNDYQCVEIRSPSANELLFRVNHLLIVNLKPPLMPDKNPNRLGNFEKKCFLCKEVKEYIEKNPHI
jgi:hypothetical protein